MNYILGRLGTDIEECRQAGDVEQFVQIGVEVRDLQGAARVFHAFVQRDELAVKRPVQPVLRF